MNAERITQLHQKVLYPVVRVMTATVGGSGTVIYSEPDPKNPSEYLTFVLTNHHVIAGAIKTVQEWNSLLLRDVKAEHLERVTVEMFDYVKSSHVNTSNSCPAEIVAYDKNEDIALLRLLNVKEYPSIAELVPRKDIPDIKLFRAVYTCGCSLLHDPFANPGFVTYLDEIIDNRLYWMTNASSIFGNSGGAVFTQDKCQFLGIPSRITAMQLGFGVDILTWMGFFIPPERVYKFLETQELKFIYDPEDDYHSAIERRKKKRRQALAELAAELQKESGG